MNDEKTVKLVRRLQPYSIACSGSNEDPFVRAIVNDCVDSETLDRLSEYTRGLYSTELHYESFMFFNRPVKDDNLFSTRVTSHPSFQPALQQTRDQLSCVRGTSIIRPDHFDEVSWIPSSAAGFGYVGLKKDNYLLARKNATRALYGFSKYRDSYRFVPDKAYARTQLALRANPKIRHVWGRAFHHILIEGLIGQPLIDKLMLNDTPIYIGRDIHKDMPYVILKAIQDGGTCYCIDFSKFDASACSGLVHIAWTILHELIVINDHVDRLVFDFCYSLFTNTPVIMPDGKLFIVRSGVPSGSYFTQLIDSIVNMLMINMLCYTTSVSFPSLKVLGDDSLFVTEVPIAELPEIGAFFAQFGLTISDKTVITENFSEIVFLGHNFYGSRVCRDEFTCLSLALYTEDPITSAVESVVRISSLLYDCGFNSFVLLNLYKRLLSTHHINWDLEAVRPASVHPPFVKLFVLG
uniref:RNA-directed RNA polymerase n=1 Tax=Scaphoideus titanus-associated partiti-like virus 1 TaxID=2716560 RepID=A0A6G7NS92_9VIRU|nr:RNA-directed RNA polymerase [Scaphoideus titanus-associated partiti-like virus 1]